MSYYMGEIIPKNAFEKWKPEKNMKERIVYKPSHPEKMKIQKKSNRLH